MLYIAGTLYFEADLYRMFSFITRLLNHVGNGNEIENDILLKKLKARFLTISVICSISNKIVCARNTRGTNRNPSTQCE